MELSSRINQSNEWWPHNGLFSWLMFWVSDIFNSNPMHSKWLSNHFLYDCMHIACSSASMAIKKTSTNRDCYITVRKRRAWGNANYLHFVKLNILHCYIYENVFQAGPRERLRLKIKNHTDRFIERHRFRICLEIFREKSSLLTSNWGLLSQAKLELWDMKCIRPTPLPGHVIAGFWYVAKCQIKDDLPFTDINLGTRLQWGYFPFLHWESSKLPLTGYYPRKLSGSDICS